MSDVKHVQTKLSISEWKGLTLAAKVACMTTAEFTRRAILERSEGVGTVYADGKKPDAPISTLMVEIPFHKTVIVTDNHGGYMAGRCMVCNGIGWLYAERVDPIDPKSNSLQHTPSCPVGKIIAEGGTVEERRKRFYQTHSPNLT